MSLRSSGRDELQLRGCVPGDLRALAVGHRQIDVFRED